MSKDVQTLLFDADGVIQTWEVAAVETMRDHLPDPSRFRDFLDDVFVAEAPCLRGEGDFLLRLQTTLDQWNVEVTAAQLIPLWSRIHTYPAMMKLIERLRASGYRCCLATNQQTYRAQTMRERYDAAFDHSFYSCDLGAAKPQTDYFERMLETLQIDASSALFIDDKVENTVAAATAGLHTLTFDARTSQMPEAELERLLAAQFALALD